MKKLFTACLLALSSAIIFAQVPTNGLVAFYPLDGNVLDSTGNGFNGTLKNGAAFVSGRLLTGAVACSFDGTDDFVYIGDVLDSVFAKSPVAYFSISGWAKINGLPANGQFGSFVTKNAGGTGPYQFSVALGSDGKLFGNVMYNSNATSMIEYAKPAPLGQWFHFCMTFNGGNTPYERLKLYINGDTATLERSLGTQGTSTINTAQGLCLGAGHSSGNASVTNNQFNGSLDEIAIYNRVLQEHEIDSIISWQPVSVRKVDDFGSVNIYPNPLQSDELYIDLMKNNLSSELNVFTVTGDMVYTGLLQERTNVIHLGDLAPGVYFITIDSIGLRRTIIID